MLMNGLSNEYRMREAHGESGAAGNIDSPDAMAAEEAGDGDTEEESSSSS